MPVPEPVTSGRGLGGGVVLGPMVSALALRLMPLKYCCLFIREDQIDVGGEMQCIISALVNGRTYSNPSLCEVKAPGGACSSHFIVLSHESRQGKEKGLGSRISGALWRQWSSRGKHRFIKVTLHPPAFPCLPRAVLLPPGFGPSAPFTATVNMCQ